MARTATVEKYMTKLFKGTIARNIAKSLFNS